MVVNQKTQLKVDTEPKRLLVTSEPYVIFGTWGYQVVVDVFEKRTKREYYIYLSARSLAKAIEVIRQDNGGKTTGLEFWLRKENDERSAPYILEE